MSRQKADDMSDMFRMTPDAFAATLHSDERAVTSEEMDAIPHFNRWHHAAKLKLPWLPDAWEWYKWDGSRRGIFLLEGGVPNLDAPRSKKWKGVAVTKVTLTDAEVEAAVLDYVTTTGNCAECGGAGERCSRAGVSGYAVRRCAACKGSGKSALNRPSDSRQSVVP